MKPDLLKGVLKEDASLEPYIITLDDGRKVQVYPRLARKAMGRAMAIYAHSQEILAGRQSALSLAQQIAAKDNGNA